jgi:hypothetical protein
MPPALVSAQDLPPLPTPNATVVALGVVSSAPKGEVLVPLSVMPWPRSIAVGSITATISFAGKDVTFLRAEKGFLLDGVKAEMRVEAQNDARDPNKMALNLEVATKGEPRKALREGLILTLVFKISEQAKPGTSVPLRFETVSATDLSEPPKAVAPLSAQRGVIEIVSPDQIPYVACFFFTH